MLEFKSRLNPKFSDIENDFCLVKSFLYFLLRPHKPLSFLGQFVSQFAS